MKTKRLMGALAGTALLMAPAAALASSHREAPAITEDPTADNTDLWAWMTPTSHANLNVVATWIPMEEPAGGPNWHRFSDDVLYEIHVTRGNVSLADHVTYQFRFRSTPTTRQPDPAVAGVTGGKEFFRQLALTEQTYSVTKIVAGSAPVELVNDAKVVPPNYGPRSQAVLSTVVMAPDYAPGVGGGTYDLAWTNTFIKTLPNGEGRVWAGPRDDGFYADLGGIFDLANLRATGAAQDGLSGYNVHAIALEIPTGRLSTNGAIPTAASNENQVGVWASSSRRKVSITRSSGKNINFGPWVQVSRLGWPLINEAIIGLQDKDKYNRSKPAGDAATFGAYYLNPPIIRDAEAVGIYGANPPTDARKFNRGNILDVLNSENFPTMGAHDVPLSATGDVLRVDLGVDSSFPNGRPLPSTAVNTENDVTDIILSFVLFETLNSVSDGVNYNDATYPGQFPYLALPWNSYNQGHGSPTP